MIRIVTAVIRRTLRSFALYGGLVLSVAVTALVWSLFNASFTGAPSQPLATGAGERANAPAALENAGWGREALVVGEDEPRWSPISVANACGLGASSCFKCHNGTRASAPRMDKGTAPWHVDHKAVNYSCAGCHHGNPRLLKKELAHSEMVVDPRVKLETSCGTCHKSEDLSQLAKSYAR